MWILLTLSAYAAPLSPSAVVDVPGERVVLMAPGPKLEARRVSDGEVLWTSDAAARPLAVSDALVLAHADKGEQGLSLVLLSLDTGEPVGDCGALSLPAWAPGIHDALGASTRVWGQWEEDHFTVQWRASAHYAGGMAPTPEMVNRARKSAEGAIRCTPGEGPEPATPTPASPTQPTIWTPEVPVAERRVVWTNGGVEVRLGDELLWTAPVHLTQYMGPYPP